MLRSHVLGILISVSVFLSAVPLATAQTLLERLAQQLENRVAREALPPSREPQPASPPTSPAGAKMLGVRLAPITDKSIRDYQLAVRRGALITAIETGSPAARAGLPVGSVIVAIDGRRIDSPEELDQALPATRAEGQSELTYYERDRLVRKTIRWPAGQAPALLPAPSSAPVLPPAPSALPPPTPTLPPPPSALSGPSPVLPTPLPARASSPAAAPTSEQPPGIGNSRPLLGRIGRIIDNVVAPAQAVDPAAPQFAQRPESSPEVAELRQQVDELRRQVELLQRQIQALERRISERP